MVVAAAAAAAVISESGAVNNGNKHNETLSVKYVDVH
jgi:hypothetical protein